VKETTCQPHVILANASSKDGHPYYDATPTALEASWLCGPSHTILQRAYSSVYAYLTVLGCNNPHQNPLRGTLHYRSLQCHRFVQRAAYRDMLSKKVGWRLGGRCSVVRANVSRTSGSKVLGALGTVRRRAMRMGVGRLI
jgi:hypothetical protein